MYMMCIQCDNIMNLIRSSKTQTHLSQWGRRLTSRHVIVLVNRGLCEAFKSDFRFRSYNSDLWLSEGDQSSKVHVSHPSCVRPCLETMGNTNPAKTWDVGPQLSYCWPTVVDGVLTVTQLWANVSCMLGNTISSTYYSTFHNCLRQ